MSSALKRLCSVRRPRVLVTSLVALLVLGGQPGRAASAEFPTGPVGLRMECNGARFPIGTPLTGDEVPGGANSGEVSAIDLIRLRGASRAVGYRYTTREGGMFVTDRATSQAQVWDYAVMNTIVQVMGFTNEIAFDPRDNGFVYYRVVWKPRIADNLTLELTRCPSAG
jgi:hypothetical protein